MKSAMPKFLDKGCIKRRVEKWKARLLAGEFKLAGGTAKRNWIKDSSGKMVLMRSGWETRFAKFLSEDLKIFWEYEPIRFDLGETTYSPDFYLPKYNVFVELKGRSPHNNYRLDLRKVDLFRQKFPQHKIIVLLSVRNSELQKFALSLTKEG